MHASTSHSLRLSPFPRRACAHPRRLGATLDAAERVRAVVAAGVRNATQTSRPMSLVVVRIDNHEFARSAYSAEMIDAAFFVLERSLARATRGGFAGRLSRDVISLALPRVEGMYAELIASRALSAVASALTLSESGLVTRLEVSVGVAQASRRDNVDQLIGRALSAATRAVGWNLAA